jgi:hypothetical protein
VTIIGITERGDAGLDFSWEESYEKQKCDGAILITKHLSTNFIERAAKYNSIVHATITGWGFTLIEGNVPSVDSSYVFFDGAVRALGKDRVVLRIDPIIPTEEGIRRATEVYSLFKGYKTRVRISFLDNYPHVKKRFQKAGIEPLDYDFHAPLSQRKEISTLFPNAEICGEPEMDCSGCISEKDLKTMNIISSDIRVGHQRPACKCLALKRELLNSRKQCASKCLYCYWK